MWLNARHQTFTLTLHTVMANIYTGTGLGCSWSCHSDLERQTIGCTGYSCTFWSPCHAFAAQGIHELAGPAQRCCHVHLQPVYGLTASALDHVHHCLPKNLQLLLGSLHHCKLFHLHLIGKQQCCPYTASCTSTLPSASCVSKHAY